MQSFFNLILRTIFLTGFLFVSLPANAEVIGEVVRSQNMPDYPKGAYINRGDEIKTGSDQKIAIKTRSGDSIVAGQNAKIKIKEPGFFSHLFGKIFYFIAPRQNNKVKVTTSMSTIGIRGTSFIIDSNAEDSSNETVSLASGMLNFESNDDQPFALYHQRELTEYELYKRQQMKEFAEYKQQMMEEFIAYKSDIDLDSGYGLKFDGKKATRVKLNENMENEFTEFEAFIADNQMKKGME